MPKKNSPVRGNGKNYDPTAAPKKRSRFAKEPQGVSTKTSTSGTGRPGSRSTRPTGDGERSFEGRKPRSGAGKTFDGRRRDAGGEKTYGARDGKPRGERSFEGRRSETEGTGFRSGERRERDEGNRTRSGDFDRWPARGQRGGSHPARNTGSVNREPKHKRREFDDSKPAFVPVEDVVLERLEAMAVSAEDVSGLTFGDLGLGKNIVSALKELGADSPFAIQAATIPDVLAGRDVLGRGRTGSGKTIAFGAPLVERLLVANAGSKRSQGRAPRAVILAPTRELAMQINRTIMPIAKSVGLFTTTIVGGMPLGPQVTSLRRGVDIVIATPGRLEDLQRRGSLSLDEIDIVVLDEADHMCDLGFLEPVQRVLRSLVGDVQHLLFSATLDKGVAAIIDEFLVDPAIHEVAGEDQSSSTIEHKVLLLEHRDKLPILKHLLRGDVSAIVFSRTRAFTDDLSDELIDSGISAVPLHGDLTQAKRAKALERFAAGKVRVLVATDVAARGIHVDDVDLVVQADAPDEYKTYLHRSGRTGRAGRHGTVITLVPHRRARKMKEMLERAEIEAATITVKPGDRHLENLL